MKNNSIDWYQNCFDSLFNGQTDNWVYQILKKLAIASDIERN